MTTSPPIAWNDRVVRQFSIMTIVWGVVGMTLGVYIAAELAFPALNMGIPWVAFAIVFFGTIVKRKVKHIYVANWFYGGFILAVALLHIVNNISIPAGFMKSYPVYGGVQDAMVQWWYGHNAVGFFLTAGFLGMMYYFVPKQIGRPIYSYRLSIVHFWALIFTYMWAGPHHLHYTALPDWTQSLGMTFSLILFAPSWGGMINGIMTLSGAWHLLRHVHLRRPDDGHQDRQRAVALHGLDHRPRPLRRAGLGRPHHHGQPLLPDPAPLGP